MKNFRDITEAKETAVFTFGRFNPPTIGHEKLIKKVSQVARSDPYQIYLVTNIVHILALLLIQMFP